MTTRRDILRGLVSTAVLAAIPIPIIEKPLSIAWQEAIAEVYSQHMSNLILFGRSGIRYIPSWPYIAVVGPEDMYADRVDRLADLLGYEPKGILGD